MENFFDLRRRSDISGFVKKKHDFCTENDNSKYLQNTKKIFIPWKSSKSQLSNDIRFSTQTQEMTEIWSNEKNVYLWVDFEIIFCEIIFIKTFHKQKIFEMWCEEMY